MSLRSVRDVVSRLLSAFILSRVDYCNAALANLPVSTLTQLQRVLHDAACLILDPHPHDHDVSSALTELPWLPIVQKIDYKLCLLVHILLVTIFKDAVHQKIIEIGYFDRVIHKIKCTVLRHSIITFTAKSVTGVTRNTGAIVTANDIMAGCQ